MGCPKKYIEIGFMVKLGGFSVLSIKWKDNKYILYTNKKNLGYCKKNNNRQKKYLKLNKIKKERKNEQDKKTALKLISRENGSN